MPNPFVKAAQTNIGSIRSSASLLESLGTRMLKATPKLEDKTPIWFKALSALAVMTGMGFLVFMEIRTGFLRGTVGLLTHRSTLKTRAKMDAELIVNSQASPEQREAIAASRMDPLYQKEFLKNKEKLKKGKQ